MAIAREEAFLRWRDAPDVPSFGIESDKLDRCIAQIRSERVNGVFGSSVFGFEEDNLDFLNELPFVESVWFWEVTLRSIDGLYALKNLRHFGVHPKRPPIQFDKFPHLETAVVEPRTRDSGLERLASLRRLNVWRHKEKDFSKLALPASLVELGLFWASASSLEHLPPLPNLRSLRIERCRNLERLGVLSEKFPNLEHLVIDTCGRVSHQEGLRAIEGLAKLERAVVQRTILVGEPYKTGD